MFTRIFLALSVISLVSAGSVSAAEYVNVTPVEAKVTEDGKRIIEMPDKKKTSRRRMLVDFGLFGAGVHVGWLKPKNMDVQQQEEGNGGEVKVVKRHGFGRPIFNVSAGSHALGLGTK